MSNVPKLRFQEFSGEWEEKSVGSLGTFFSGGTPTSSNKTYYDGSIPFIGSGKIGEKEVEQFITEEALNSSSAKMVEVGDLLYALYGATSGEVAISKINGAINQAVLCIRTSANKIFVKTWLEKNKEKILCTYLQGGQGNLSAQIVKSLKLKLPSKPEQEKIASFLTSVDIKIELLTKKEELLQQYKKGVMQKIFSQEIRFKADDGSEYPEWEEKKLGNLCKFQQGYQIPSSEQVKTKLDGYKRYLYISDFFSDSNITYVKYKDSMNLMTKDDIAVANTGNTAGSFYKGREGVLSNNMFFITILSKLTPEFLYVFLESSRYEKQLKQFFNSGGQPHLGHKNMSMIRIAYPCIEEQTKIANFLSSIDSKIEHIQNQLNATKAFKKALLQQMFV